MLFFAAALFSTALLSAHEQFRVIGTVTSVTGVKMAVRTKEGETAAITLNMDTTIKRDGKAAPASAIKAGQSVVVDAYGDDYDDLLAIDIRIVPPISAPTKTPARK